MENSLKTSSVENDQESPSIFGSLDFRQYLKAYYAYRKRVRPSYSLTVMAERAGFSSSNHLKMIIDGTRTLNRTHARGLTVACRLNPDESKYFLILVDWMQAENEQDKLELWNQLVAASLLKSVRQLKSEGQLLLSQWFTLALLELVRCRGFSSDPRTICKAFAHRVTPVQVMTAVNILRETGLVIESDGKLFPSDKVVSIGSEVPSLLIQNYHCQNHQIGIECIKKVSIDRREYGSVSIAIRQEDMAKYKSLIRDFQKQVACLAAETDSPTAVYQLNLQFFPVAIGEGE